MFGVTPGSVQVVTLFQCSQSIMMVFRQPCVTGNQTPATCTVACSLATELFLLRIIFNLHNATAY